MGPAIPTRPRGRTRGTGDPHPPAGTDPWDRRSPPAREDAPASPRRDDCPRLRAVAEHLRGATGIERATFVLFCAETHAAFARTPGEIAARA